MNRIATTRKIQPSRAFLGATLLLAGLLAGCDKAASIAGPDPTPLAEPTVAPSPTPAPVANRPPDAVFTPPDPRSGVAPLTVRFDMCGSKDPDGDRVRFTYDFNDGSGIADLSSCWATHAYGSAGKFTARVCVTDTRAGHEVCEDFGIDVSGAASGKPESHTYAHDIGYGSCPTKATTFSDSRRITATNPDQALAACEACMGPGACTLDLADCAGPAFGNPAFASADQPRWGYLAGCTGGPGRVFKNGDSTTTFGRWAD